MLSSVVVSQVMCASLTGVSKLTSPNALDWSEDKDIQKKDSLNPGKVRTVFWNFPGTESRHLISNASNIKLFSSK